MINPPLPSAVPVLTRATISEGSWEHYSTERGSQKTRFLPSCLTNVVRLGPLPMILKARALRHHRRLRSRTWKTWRLVWVPVVETTCQNHHAALALQPEIAQLGAAMPLAGSLGLAQRAQRGAPLRSLEEEAGAPWSCLDWLRGERGVPKDRWRPDLVAGQRERSRTLRSRRRGGRDWWVKPGVA